MDANMTGILAHWYSGADVDPDAEQWADYGKWLSGLDLRGFEPTQGDPYANARDMFSAYECPAARVYIYSGGEIAEGGHPVWSEHVNWRFRCVHDTAHYVSRGVFSFEGELAAAQAQIDMTPHFRDVILTEIVAQYALFAWRGGVFSPNKASVIPQDLFKGARYDDVSGVMVTEASVAWIRKQRACVHRSLARLL